MSITFEDFKEKVLAKKEVILELYTNCLTARDQAKKVKTLIDEVTQEILNENEFRVRFGYGDVIGHTIIKDVDFIAFIDDEDLVKLNEQFLERIKDNELYLSYYNLSAMDETFKKNIVFIYPNAADYLKVDVELINFFGEIVNYDKNYKVNYAEQYKNIEDLIKNIFKE